MEQAYILTTKEGVPKASLPIAPSRRRRGGLRSVRPYTAVLGAVGGGLGALNEGLRDNLFSRALRCGYLSGSDVDIRENDPRWRREVSKGEERGAAFHKIPPDWSSRDPSGDSDRSIVVEAEPYSGHEGGGVPDKPSVSGIVRRARFSSRRSGETFRSSFGARSAV